MKPQYIVPLFLFLAFNSALHAQSVEWDRLTNDTASYLSIWPHSIAAMSDGGSIIACQGGAGYLIRLDRNGNVLWRWHTKDASVQSLESVQATSDGGCIAAGYATGRGRKDSVVTRFEGRPMEPPFPDGASYKDTIVIPNEEGFVVRLNADGTTRWQRKYGGYYTDVFYSVCQTHDGGFIAAGVKYPTHIHPWFSATPVGDGWVVKLDPDGNVQWEKRIGGDYDDRVRSIRPTTDGGYILCMESESANDVMAYDSLNGRRDNNGALVKLDSLGNVEWKAGLGKPERSDFVRAVQQTRDGGYILSGYSRITNSIDNHVWLVKTSSHGIIEWETLFPNDWKGYGGDIQETSDGGYVTVGQYMKKMPSGKTGFWLGWISATGKLVREDCYGDNEWETASALTLAPDGAIIVVGRYYKIVSSHLERRKRPMRIGDGTYYEDELENVVEAKSDIRVIKFSDQ